MTVKHDLVLILSKNGANGCLSPACYGHANFLKACPKVKRAKVLRPPENM